MSENQFPGQGGQQYPQQGGGQPFPQQGGQPFPQQGGQPFPQQGGQPFPQQGGQPFPQQGGQPFPQQGGQPFPQQGGQPFPQQGGQPYPQQGGQPPGGGQYPAAGGPGQFGGRPGAPGGYPPQPAKPKSTGMVIGIVVAALAAVGLAGWLLMSLFGGSGEPTPTPTPSVEPTVSAPSTTAPSPSPSTQPTSQPTEQPSPSTSATAQPPSGSLEVGLGVSVTPASGWRQSHRNEVQNYTELTNGSALLVTQAFQVQGQVTGKDVVASYMKQITANMTGVTTKEPATMDVKNDRLSVGIGSWAGTRATSQGSIKLSYLTIISVRDDGLSVMSTLIVPAPVTVASQQTDYLTMTNSLLTSQLKA